MSLEEQNQKPEERRYTPAINAYGLIDTELAPDVTDAEGEITSAYVQ